MMRKYQYVIKYIDSVLYIMHDRKPVGITAATLRSQLLAISPAVYCRHTLA